MSRTPQPCASVTLPFSTMAIVTPGTPNCLAELLDALLETGRRRGAAADASNARAKPLKRTRHERFMHRAASIRVWARSGAALRVPQLPDADRHERQDEDGEQDVGERAVAVGDQGNEAEPARRANMQPTSSTSAMVSRARCDQRSPAARCQAWSMRSLMAWTELVPLSSSAEKIISWNSRWKAGMPIRCSRKSDGRVAL